MMKKLLFLMLSCLMLTGFNALAQIDYFGNGNGGFGEPVGGSNLTISDDGDVVAISFNKGTGDFNDEMVIYIDSRPGGFTSTANFADPDAGDKLRRAITGAGIFDGGTRSVVNFPSGFGADFAIAVNTDFGGLWELIDNNTFPFVTGVGNPTDNMQSNFQLLFNKTDIGIGATDNIAFNFVITYMDGFGGNGVFRSDEGYGAGLPVGNPGTGDVTFSSFELYDSTLGIDTNSLQNIHTSLKNNQLTVVGVNANATIEMYNLLGQQVFIANKITINNSIQFNNLSIVKGVYLLKLIVNNQTKTFKLINQ